MTSSKGFDIAMHTHLLLLLLLLLLFDGPLWLLRWRNILALFTIES
jgi:hypothetical protein